VSTTQQTITRAIDWPELSLAAIEARMRHAWSEGRGDEAGALASLGLIIARRQRQPADRITPFLSLIGAIAFESGDLGEAEQRFGQVLHIARKAGTAKSEAAALSNLGAIANVRGDFAVALWNYRCARGAFRRANSTNGEARALQNMGMVHADLRRFKEAAECYEAARVLAIDCNDPELITIITLNMIEVDLKTGHLDRAHESCENATRLAIEIGSKHLIAESHRYEGEIHRRLGEVEKARCSLEQAISMSHDADIPLAEAEALRSMGELHLSQNDREAALGAFGQAFKLFIGLDAKHELAESVLIRIIEQLSAEEESRDPYLYGHSARVADLAVAIADEMGLDCKTKKAILVAGYLHDIGKLDVDPAVLEKKGELTAQELAHIRDHAAFGAARLEKLNLPWDIVPMVRHHHERFDGTGYPCRLAGEEIPLGARILSVVDMFEALTSDRPYRLAWNPDWALHYIESSAGHIGDPKIVEAFMRVVRKLGLATEGGAFDSTSHDVVQAFSTIEEPEKLRAVAGG
jgi:putative nucleotidyltransferase with HDIG domain